MKTVVRLVVGLVADWDKETFIQIFRFLLAG